MRVLLPKTQFEGRKVKPAPRPANLNGTTIGFLDGWGHRLPDGHFEMYPLMGELKKLLEQRYKLKGTLWFHKPNISKPASPEQFSTLIREADVVINGECA